MKLMRILAVGASIVLALPPLAQAKPSKAQAAAAAKSPGAQKPIIGDILQGTDIRRNNPKPVVGDILDGTNIRRNGVVISWEDMTPVERLRYKLKRLLAGKKAKGD